MSQNDFNKIWVTHLDVRGLNIQSGTVYSTLRSAEHGNPMEKALEMLGTAINTTSAQEGCASGRILLNVINV